MKRNEFNIPDVWSRLNGHFGKGMGKVIGKRPKYLPYVVIEGPDGNQVAWLEPRQMKSLIKRWKEANP